MQFNVAIKLPTYAVSFADYKMHNKDLVILQFQVAVLCGLIAISRYLGA